MRRCLVVILFANAAAANVLRVPVEFPTLQDALNVLSDGDTVLASVGVYEEALVAPPLSFTLLGDVASDTGEYPRPVIDPSRLAGSDSLGCLRLSGGLVFIRDFVFRNRSPMYPRRDDAVGGIHSSAARLSAYRCIFDSTYVGVFSPDSPVRLEQCVFAENHQFCVYAGGSRIDAANTRFHGHSNWSLLQCGDSSEFIRCQLSNGPGDAHLVIVQGTGVRFDGCLFGPAGASFSFPVMADLASSSFVGNLFTGCTIGNAVVNANCACDSPIVFKANDFHSNHTLPERPDLRTYQISAITPDTIAFCTGVIADSNTFASSRSGAVFADGRDTVRVNRFRDLEEAGAALMVAYRETYARQNTFDRTGLAAEAEWPGILDARWNWWGHSSGPYHPALNPAAQGDSVGNNVLFDPWYPDTSFLRTERESRLPAPHAYALHAYPNPFNAAARIALEVPAAGIIRVDVFDVLGRRVRELFWGPVGMRKELLLNGANLSSGVYFVRATDTILNRPVATAKIVLLK